MESNLRNPEYTGDRRCIPCTVVNVLLTVAAAVLAYVAGATFLTSPWGYVSAALILAVGFIAVWLRGYLVPYTPTLTRRLLPEKLRPTHDPVAGDVEEASDVERVLVDAGAVEYSEEATDLVLTPEFERRWMEAIDDVPDDVDYSVVLEELGFSEEEEDVQTYSGRGEEGSEAFAVEVVDRGASLAKWPSRTALRVDYASAELLEDRVDEWMEQPPEWRSRVVRGLRVFLERCPDGDDVVESKEEVPSCCSRRMVYTLSCRGSGARLLEQEIPNPR